MTAYAVAEDITLTTYYPSPRGVYNTLRSSVYEDRDNTAYYLDPNNGGTSLVVAGNTTIGGSANVTGALTAASATLSGALSAGSANVSGNLTANSANVSGNLTAGSLNAGVTALGATNVNGSLNVTGPTNGPTFITPSDVRFKTNITPLNGALDKLEGVQPITFEHSELFTSLGYPATDARELGVIAQDLELVYPELVTVWGDERYRGIDYSKLTVVLLGAIKELKAKNEALEQRIMQLEARQATRGE
jgi:hypothetical protein